ncbi:MULTISPECIES: hypothetical protein [Mycobacteriaceae]|uniref:Uncharacterized protein n=1 Tax=Mycolicibacterium parafortuitum TaxID=39692 RepID=A0ACC6MFQ4_MYCPF|nr:MULTISPECIES: hypothetical protein [Mycobacteriaceae]MDZ5085804.1 hypothetical protein [Mycolicibacterium parafortuitum]
MRVAVKPVITTSVALVGASVLAVAPLEPPAPATARVVEQDVSLTASSLAYVPINAIEQVFSAPANMVAALDRLATALAISGSWNESHPNNVWGWDPANPDMLREAVNVLVPFPSFSQPWGEHLNWWAAANLPMYEGCAYECEDLPGMLDLMFKVPMSEFYDEDGYTFPTVINPIDGQETEWSEQQVILDPAEPIKSVWASLTAEPTGIQTVTWWEVVTAVANFSAALQITGHLPDWIAVREIETFFKHFLREPEEDIAPEDEESETPAEANAMLVASSVGLSPVAAPSDVAPVAEEADEAAGGESAAATDQGESSIVAKATDELKKKFESAPIVADVIDEASEDVVSEDVTEDSTIETDSDEAATEEDADEAGAEEDADEAVDESAEADADAEADSSTTGGKHRKDDDSSGSSQSASSSSSDSSDTKDSDSGDSKGSDSKGSDSKGSDSGGSDD